MRANANSHHLWASRADARHLARGRAREDAPVDLDAEALHSHDGFDADTLACLHCFDPSGYDLATVSLAVETAANAVSQLRES